jgi:predicted Zn-dependent protease
MIIMTPPNDGSVPYKRHIFKSTGREARFNQEAGSVICYTVAEANELEKEGWQRQVAKFDTDDLRKAAEVGARRAGIVIAMPRRITAPAASQECNGG